MSDLHLSLMGFGLLVIIGVVVYNWIQERRFRKIAQQRFQAPREDVLMTEPDPSIGATTLGRATLNDVRIEPKLSEEDSALIEPEVEPEPEVEATPLAPAAKTRKAGSEIPAPIDVNIDYVVRLDFAEPVQAAALRAALGASNPGKTLIWRGLDATGQWEDVTSARDRVEFSALYGALQLADRAGALTGEEITEFSSQVQQAAETLMAVAQMPERQIALDTAAKLDEFCADVDILVGINVIALDQDTFPGTKIRALAEAGGFKLASDGTYQYHDDHGAVLYTLTNQESAPFKTQEMKYLNTHGLTLLFDVPRIPNGLRSFDHMIQFARQLSDSLKGMLVDDNLRPLTDEGIAKIKQQISMIYGKMDKHGIPAGSARAQRLFS
ncbi:MAG: cell division protein ZipA C-terminal FtsZ-binding domain-containing protein [Hydrogenophilales bacterium]|nr:cell division protein ZipA C-terminal FtsZ-binding domain-containing protein [Hydrogenophilales bacterium]